MDRVNGDVPQKYTTSQHGSPKQGQQESKLANALTTEAKNVAENMLPTLKRGKSAVASKPDNSSQNKQRKLSSGHEGRYVGPDLNPNPTSSMSTTGGSEAAECSSWEDDFWSKTIIKPKKNTPHQND